jgi:alpha-D-ribose 1-methylphosphonate 5-triphosphate synthase subunit PhnH
MLEKDCLWLLDTEVELIKINCLQVDEVPHHLPFHSGSMQAAHAQSAYAAAVSAATLRSLLRALVSLSPPCWRCKSLAHVLAR